MTYESVSVELKSPARIILAPCFWQSNEYTALVVAIVLSRSLGKYAVINHTVSFPQVTCTCDTLVSLDASVTSSCVRVAAPCDLIPLVDEWQLQVSAGVVSFSM